MVHLHTVEPLVDILILDIPKVFTCTIGQTDISVLALFIIYEQNIIYKQNFAAEKYFDSHIDTLTNRVVALGHCLRGGH